MTFWRPSRTGKRPEEMENALRRINATLAAFDEALNLSAKNEMGTADVLVPAGTDVRKALLRFEREYSDLIPNAHAARRELALATETARDWGERAEEAASRSHSDLAEQATLRQNEHEMYARLLQEDVNAWDETVR